MSNSLARTFDAIMSVLTDEVVPRVDDAFARGQALAIVDLLRNLGLRLEWAHAQLWQQIEAQEAALRRVGELCAGQPARPPASPERSFATEHPDAAALLARRDELESHLSETLAWLAAHRSQLPAPLAGEFEAALRRYMQEQLQRDMAVTATPLFREISSGGGKTDDR